MCRILNTVSAICCLLSLYFFSLCLYGSPPRSSGQNVHHDCGESPLVGARGKSEGDNSAIAMDGQ
jgi:hypothetical protein